MDNQQSAAAPGRAGFRSGVLHGRVQGRRLRAGQSHLLRDSLPSYALPPDGPLDAASLFGRAVAGLRLEVGFGGGEHLIAEARTYSDVGFIGCEPFRNLRIAVGDAGEVIDRLPDQVLSGCDLLFPDPWPKRRQRKRRFVSATMLGRLARVLRRGGLLHFATDIDDYAGWTLARIAASAEFDWPAERADDWREPWAGWTETRYAAKARRAGRQPVFLTFTRR